LQAAWTSAVSFSAGAILPLAAIGLSPASERIVICVAVTLVALVLLGDTGARLGGAPRLRAIWRVLAWGAVAMAVTAAIGALVGTTTG
jgi:VIT1/CCC1 family predicted Fe2+/Mn2+ transporter